MEEMSENLKGRDHTEGLGVEGEDNIKMDRREIGWEVVDRMHMAKDRTGDKLF